MGAADYRMATDATLMAVKEAIEALPNATQTAADNANAAATAATNAIAQLGGLVAGTYSTNSTYEVGDYVYYSGNLYRCIVQIDTAEEWTPAHWEQVALADDVRNLKSEISDICPEKEFVTGYFSGFYYDDNLDLQSNESSVYKSYDCEGYEIVVVETASAITSNATRHMGFKLNGVKRSVYSLQSIVNAGWCVPVDGHYETRIPISGDTFYCSLQSSNPPLNIRLEPTVIDKVIDTVYTPYI